MDVCVYILFSGWCTRRPDLSTANTMLPILIYNFVRGEGSAVLRLLVSEGHFIRNPLDFLCKRS